MLISAQSLALFGKVAIAKIPKFLENSNQIEQVLIVCFGTDTDQAD